jgi:hypothetical protein
MNYSLSVSLFLIQKTQKIAKLEKSLQTQTENYKKLHEEKTKLQTVIETEHDVLNKLKFDVTVLNMTCEKVKVCLILPFLFGIYLID